ncbi:GNAT family N-acetyltransferase [Paenibacillus ihbetae]|uniref:GNAT family N-acetyltransferase n=1 Tax=Paenibacillus ihbetae TaxID=1870820 RepID=A0A1B2E1J9_9BACL|nr:GNAT family N-acetyltransferase [Paenibacillus ihbetae]ANY73858.1 GNAT family N-acetyltransferase [Paenibacillus ihbetae]OOC63958.1 GNAT family N-acetyltransferase [Paenibacillus ihbetae]
MNIEVRLCPKEQSFILHNLYPLYLHDIAEIWGIHPNRYGVFEKGDVPTLSEQSKLLDVWWEQPSVLFPYLITVDDVAAGFALVSTPPQVPSANIQYYLSDFFVLRTYRRQGVARRAAELVFDQFQGAWELQTNPTERNMSTQIFWRKTLNTYTGGKYSELDGVHPEKGEMLVFRFTNK